MAPHTIKPEVESLCVMGVRTPEDDDHQVYAVHIRPPLTHRQKPLSSLKRHSNLQSTPSGHQISRVWRCRVVGGSLICVLLQAYDSKWSLLTQQVQHVPGFLSLDAIREATAASFLTWSVLLDRPEPGLRAWEFTHHC